MALWNPTFETDNVIMGSLVGNSVTNVQASVIIGSYAASNTTSINNSVLIGFGAGDGAGNFNRNVAMGFRALGGTNGKGSDTIAIGNNAGYANLGAIGSSNILIGTYSGNNCAGDNNILIQNTTAGASLTNGDNNIVIGGAGVAGEDNTIRIGNETHDATYVHGINNSLLTDPVVGSYPVVVGSDDSLSAGVYLTYKYRAEINSQSVSATLALPVINTDTLCNIPTASLLIDDAQFDMPSDGVLRYIGPIGSIYAHIFIDGSVKMASGSSQEITLSMKRNGTSLQRAQYITLSAGNIPFSFQQWVTLSQNDTISLYVKNASGTNDIIFTSFAISVNGSY
jgi:hypothetical protein